MDAIATATRPAHDQAPSRLLCAYSPTWLSGPTPSYQGLCPSLESAATTTEERRDPLD